MMKLLLWPLGTGSTPHARGLDGRLALRSGIKEALIGEVLHRLGVPTSRALYIASTQEAIEREQEPVAGGVMTRVGSTILRVGTMQCLEREGDYATIRRLIRHLLWEESNYSIYSNK